MKTMSKFQVQKRNGGVVHAGYEFNEYVMSDCGAGRSHNRAGATEARTWVKVSAPVTCKRCLKKIEKAEYLGLHLKVVDNEDGSSKVVDTREEAAPEPQAEAPAVDEHAAAVARMYANIDAEEERRAAARRARNRTNYASTPVLVIDAETSPKARKSHSVGRKLAQDHGLNFF